MWRRIDSFEIVKATRPAREASAGGAVEWRAEFSRWSVQLPGREAEGCVGGVCVCVHVEKGPRVARHFHIGC